MAAQQQQPVPLQTTPVAPRRFETRRGATGDSVFADFGKDAYGNLQITLPRDPPAAATLTVRLGEKLGGGADGGGAAIDRKPPGSVNYREVTLDIRPGTRVYRLTIPTKPFHRGAASVKTPPEIGEITPFRYVEIEGSPVPLDRRALRQLFVHAPFDDRAAEFSCSDATLNAVWELCGHTMKATTAFGVYIDGERERIPYEADAYINQLSHYAFDLDPRVTRATVDHLLAHPTWPTEWSLHMPMMAAADYDATGDPALALRHWETLKKKLLLDRARPEDGLLRAGGIVDWPAGERDGYNEGRADPRQRQQVGPEINTVVNAFYCHALERMATLAAARAVKRDDEARDLKAKAAQVRAAVNARLFDPARGVYTDGEGSDHASLHANLFPLAFGLVPTERVARVADFVMSRGMACSVYAAQYLLEALFLAGRDAAAIRLLTDRGERGWWHMIELGSTMTLEAWDAKFKPNLTWNHAWGAAPANIASRFLLGVRPLEPGYGKVLVAPQPGGLKWVRGKVPTPKGPVSVKVEEDGPRFRLEVEIPDGTTARLALPRRAAERAARVTLDGRTVDGRIADGRIADGVYGAFLAVDGVGPGRHVLEARG